MRVINIFFQLNPMPRLPHYPKRRLSTGIRQLQNSTRDSRGLAEQNV
jgi:hypothetical protein